MHAILLFAEVPNLETVLIERPVAPYLGVGEATQGPTAAAIADAVYDAIRLRESLRLLLTLGTPVPREGT